MSGTVQPVSDGAALIRRQTLAEQIHDVLLAKIVQGEYRPGERINVDAVADDLQVSRTPVREAMTRLAWSGFVVVERNARTTVTRWGAADMHDRLMVVLGLLQQVVTAEAPPHLPSFSGGGDEMRDWLACVATVVAHANNRVAAQVVLEQLAPLRLFLDRDDLSVISVNLACSRDARREHLSAAQAAADAGDGVSMCSALITCGELVAAALIRPASAVAAL